MHLLQAHKLRRIVADILIAVGATRQNAGRVAEALVLSNLSGVDTHGILHLPTYVVDVEQGLIDARGSAKVIRSTASTALVSGGWTFGHVAAHYAMELAIGQAHAQGISVVSMVETNHIGRLGEYSEMAAAEGMVGLVSCSGMGIEEPDTAPYGGRHRAPLNTNPISGAFPGGESGPLTFDFATTTMSGSKIIMSSLGLIDVVPGAIVDRDGIPTTDPEKFEAGGAHTPFGGHKGYALLVGIEVLGRVLSGADDFSSESNGSRGCGHQGVTMIVLRADVFRPLEEFTNDVDTLITDLRLIEPAEPFKEVLAPGDPEKQAYTQRSVNGIPIREEVWDPITSLAERLGVSLA